MNDNRRIFTVTLVTLDGTGSVEFPLLAEDLAEALKDAGQIARNMGRKVVSVYEGD